MLFSSNIFLFYFLPLVVGVYLLLPGRFKNFFLLVVSLFFYTWGEKQIVLVLIATTIADFAYGLIIERGYRKTGLILSLITNMAFLAFFKYFNFAFENFKTLLDFLNIAHPGLEKAPGILLPIGISFYTFQTMSYTIDVYRGKVKASRNFIDYAAYVTMFPQLVAGPIVRYSDIEKQLKSKHIDLQNFTLGLQRFIIGLAKKMLIANSFAEVVDVIFSHSPTELSSYILWFGAIAYALQLYYDFSGYSDMAIGIGRMLGFTFPENFNYPYISKSVREFWRRWHITLSTWFRDYLYISLGGNRVSPMRLYLNLSIVFFATGLWHGASWNFVLWGLVHGFFISIERAGFSKILTGLWLPLQHLYTLLVWILSMVLFRSPDIAFAKTYYITMFSFSQGDIPLNSFLRFFYIDNEILILLIVGTMFSMPIFSQLQTRLIRLFQHNGVSLAMGTFFKIAFYALLFTISASMLSANAYNPFIYFRF